ncbi:MAG: MXAN_6640 family putative metalloprotease [Myxococcota bacterium]
MLTLALLGLAHGRPDGGTGLYTFDDTDVVVSMDSPAATVRVWYSVDGPNVVDLDDADADGVPDFAAEVAVTAEHVLEVYAAAGFRAPLSDGVRGGSDAMDVYLVDFAGNADGMYAAESCSSRPTQCSGYFVMENDFAGYGYADLASAIRVLTSHELFHAVQAAYDAEEEIWFSEGTAVWAENLYDPGNADFLRFCSAYLDDPGRSLDEPPSGPVPTFAYATGLWWWFLSNRYGDDMLVALLESTEASDTLLADMAVLQEERGGALAEDFATFARWNLATGAYAGAAESYPFAAELGAPRAEDDGAHIDDDNRFYPLATTYYRLEHPGGEVWFAAEADAPELAFSLHATTPEGDVRDALTTFAGAVTPLSLGELDAGDYWLVGSNPTLAEESTKVRVCLGSAADVAACAPTADPAEDTAGAADTSAGCGCATTTGTVPGALLTAGMLLGARRRRG